MAAVNNFEFAGAALAIACGDDVLCACSKDWFATRFMETSSLANHAFFLEIELTSILTGGCTAFARKASYHAQASVGARK